MLELQQQITHDWTKVESIKHCHLNAAQYQQESAVKEQLAPQDNSSNHGIQATANPQQWRSRNQTLTRSFPRLQASKTKMLN